MDGSTSKPNEQDVSNADVAQLILGEQAGISNEQGVSNADAEEIINRKAHKLADCCWLSHHTQEDLAQELWLKYLARCKKAKVEQFDSKAITQNVVNQAAKDLIRRAKAKKRCPRAPVVSLDTTPSCSEDGKVPLSQTISQSEHDEWCQQPSERKVNHSDLRIELEASIASLPEDDQRLIVELRASKSVAEIARTTGVKRTTLNGQLLGVRRHFEKDGLQQYLGDVRRLDDTLRR